MGKLVGRYRPKMVGSISARQIFWGGSDPAHKLGMERIRADPSSMLFIYAETGTVIVHVLHATQTVAEAVGRRRRRLPSAVFMDVIIFVQVWLNLVDVWCIKCTLKVASGAVIFRQNCRR